MNSAVSLPHQLYQRLVRKSQRLHRTPEEVVTDLVRQYVSESDDRWRADFQTLIDRVQARSAAFSSTEIEADVTAAAAEARELRRARRSA